MTEGFKGTLIGGIIGILVVVLGVLVLYRVSNIKPDWVVATAIPMAFAISGWYIAYMNRQGEELKKQLESKAEKIEMEKQITWLDSKIDEHITTDNMLYSQLSTKIETLSDQLTNKIEYLGQKMDANYKEFTRIIIEHVQTSKKK